MDFELSESQALLEASADAFAADHFGEAALLTLAVGGEPPDPWPQFRALGWSGLRIAETYGGSGAGMGDAVVLLERLGYSAVPSTLVVSGLVAAELVATLGDTSQRERWLPALAAGSAPMTLAWVEAGGEQSLEALEAVLDGAGRASGEKRFVPDADRCTQILAVTRAAAGPRGESPPEDDLRVVVLDPADCELEPMETLSGERRFAVAFDEVPLAPDRILGGGEGGTRTALSRAIDLGALARAAESVGLAQRVLDIVVQHLKVREQSGQPLGAFQALQHAAADMLRNVEAARGLVRGAVWVADQERDRLAGEAGRAIAMAKAYCAEKCLETARRGHQLMGAIGYCEEHPLHLLHKRIQAAALDFGDARDQLDRLADDLGLG